MQSNAKRIEWIDIAKGFSIILVVYGHGGLASIPYLGDFFSAFRMPFFFLCSGILFNYTKFPDIKSLIKRRYITLIRPFLLFSLIVLSLEYFIQLNYLDYLKHTILNGWGGYALWFIPVLFFTELWYYLLYKFCGNSNKLLVCLIMSTIFGYITYKLRFPNYYNLCFVLTSVLFYGIGNILRDRIIKYFQSSNVARIILTLICTFIVTLLFLLNPKTPEFAVNSLVGPITYITGISGAFMMCCIAAVISNLTFTPIQQIKYVIVFMGKNSYVVLAFHQIILMLLGKYTNLPGVIARLIMWSILVFLIFTINRFFPYILGRNKQYIAQ